MHILPRPKFSLKWELNLYHCPQNWRSILENVLSWTLAQHLCYRDSFLSLDVCFVSENYWRKIEADLLLVKPAEHVHQYSRRENLYLGSITCSSYVIYQANKNKVLYEELVRIFAKGCLDLMQIDTRKQVGYLRKVLAKFALTPTP